MDQGDRKQGRMLGRPQVDGLAHRDRCSSSMVVCVMILLVYMIFFHQMSPTEHLSFQRKLYSQNNLMQQND
jgi:hypothetical protein